jgi:hypothetical protein
MPRQRQRWQAAGSPGVQLPQPGPPLVPAFPALERGAHRGRRPVAIRGQLEEPIRMRDKLPGVRTQQLSESDQA